METVGDIDILVTCDKPLPAMERFQSYPEIERLVGAGMTRGTVILRSGLQVDLRTVPEVSYGAALTYFTGSKAHNIAVGARIGSLLDAGDFTLEEVMFAPGSAARITATVRQIVFSVEKWRFEDGIERVYLLYHRPLKGSGSHPTGVQLLPVNLRRFQRLKEERWPSRTLPTFTLERDRLLSALLRQYFFVSLFRACAESLAAENASRLAAMQAAEKNLADRHEQLLGEFRRRRQDAITAELLDVVAGYEAIRTSSRENEV